MENEYLTKQTMVVFSKIAVSLINPNFRFSNGGEPIRIISNALKKLEKKFGGLSRERVVDYCVSSAYAFKDRGDKWKINQVFGPRSIQRIGTDSGLRYYENQWLLRANITRESLIALIADKANHPQSRYVYLPTEEPTKRRMLNQNAGYLICQSSTLGWSPESECCCTCRFSEECKIETQRKFPEIYRLRIETNVVKK